jgi:hypothetical protein
LSKFSNSALLPSLPHHNPYCLGASSLTVAEERSLLIWGNFEIFREKSSKIDHFTVDSTGLPFAVAEIQSLPLSGDFRYFSSKIIKNKSFDFGPTGLSFAVAEIRSLPVWGNFRDFSSKNHQK